MSTELETRDHALALTRFAAGHGRTGVQIRETGPYPGYVRVASRAAALALAHDLIDFARGLERSDEPGQYDGPLAILLAATLAERSAESRVRSLDRHARPGHDALWRTYARTAAHAYDRAARHYRDAGRLRDADRCAAAAAVTRGRLFSDGGS